MTSITKNDNSVPHKMFKRKKKMLNRLHFPPTLPHSTHILLWRRTGEPTHDLHHQERQQNVQKKKDVFTFPPSRTKWRTENQHMTSITKNDNSGPHKMFKRKKDVKSFTFPSYPPAFHPHSFVAQDRRTNT
ncbi:hypothetical protein TNCV_2796851 [Trichonephila clavipes]|nr:hypothetical protein TNCV_2796851 [Trichonephila clavipes]